MSKALLVRYLIMSAADKLCFFTIVYLRSAVAYLEIHPDTEPGKEKNTEV